MRGQLAFVLGVLISGANAFAAEPLRQYPPQCAVDVCERVVRISSADTRDDAAPRVVVVSEHREAVVADPFPVFQVADRMMHACMRYDPFGELVVSCLLLPSAD